MKYVAIDKVDNNIIIRGDLCITTLTDLYQVLIDPDTTEIELRKSFCDKFFTYTALCEFVSSASQISPGVRIWAENTVQDDITDIAKDLLYITDKDELIFKLVANESKYLPTIKQLCREYLTANDESSIATSKMSTMLMQIADLQKSLEREDKKYSELMDRYNVLSASHKALTDRVNFQYEKTEMPSDLMHCSENQFNHILYIKEISRIHYTDTLIYYLSEIIKTTYSEPTRLVVIEPYFAYNRVKMYKDLKPHWDLTYNDVYGSDIFMAGFQPKLMTDILYDPNHIHYLIVLDRGGYIVPHIESGNTTLIYTVSDMADAPYGVPSDRIISYSEDTLNIPYIEDFNTKATEEKIMLYSSMDITKKLIEYLEEA